MDKLSVLTKLSRYFAAIFAVTCIDIEDLIESFDVSEDGNVVNIYNDKFKLNDHPFHLEFIQYKQDDIYFLNMNVHLGYAVEMLEVINSINRLSKCINESLVYYELVGGEEVYLPFRFESESEIDSIGIIEDWLTKLFSDEARDEIKILTELCSFTKEQASKIQ